MGDMDLNKKNGQLYENRLYNFQNNKILNTNNIADDFEINTFHPWRRLFAIWIDGFIFCLLGFLFSRPLIKSFNIQAHSKGETLAFFALLFSILLYLLCMVYPLCIRLCGTSIGKNIFGIRIVDDNKKLIGFAKGFKRTILTLFFSTWFIGFILLIIGFFFPDYCQHHFLKLLLTVIIIHIIPLLDSYFYYKSHSKTRWDKKLNINVIFKKKLSCANTGFITIFIIAQIIFLFLAFIFSHYGINAFVFAPSMSLFCFLFSTVFLLSFLFL